MKYDVLEIKKCDEKISKCRGTVINDIRLIALFAVVLFSCEKGIIEDQATEILSAGSVCGGTLSITSLVKTICNIYLANQKKKELECEDRRK